MAPPSLPLRHYADASVLTARQVTEDTPPDLLQGSMKLKVTLPSGKQTSINVHRSTPMMDVLVQVTSANKINPGNHAIRVICNNRNVSYKPSTAVGSLDTSAIEIISKTNNEEGTNKDDKQYKDKKVRLKVNLPKNQLAVYRLPPKTLISEVLSMICEDKNLEEERFEIRHPVNVDELLRGSCSLSDYQLQEVCIVSKNYRPPPLSVNDLFAMSSLSHHREERKRTGFRAFFSRKNKHITTGNSSLSSGSTGDRSESPENESTKLQSSRLSLNVADGLKYRLGVGQKLTRPTSLLNLNRVSKKRPAPMPPREPTANGNFINGNVAAISCHDISIGNGSRTLTPLSSEVEEERKNSSGSCSRNSNSSSSEFGPPSKMKRKAPLPPPTKAQVPAGPEAVSSHEKDCNNSPSPDFPMFPDSETRSTTPSEVSIDVRPSSSDVSDVIAEEEVKQDTPLALIGGSRCHSSSSSEESGGAGIATTATESLPELSKKSGVSDTESNRGEEQKESSYSGKLEEKRGEEDAQLVGTSESAEVLADKDNEVKPEVHTISETASVLEEDSKGENFQIGTTAESVSNLEENKPREMDTISESTSIENCTDNGPRPVSTKSLDPVNTSTLTSLAEASNERVATANARSMPPSTKPAQFAVNSVFPTRLPVHDGTHVEADSNLPSNRSATSVPVSGWTRWQIRPRRSVYGKQLDPANHQDCSKTQPSPPADVATIIDNSNNYTNGWSRVKKRIHLIENKPQPLPRKIFRNYGSYLQFESPSHSLPEENLAEEHSPKIVYTASKLRKVANKCLHLELSNVKSASGLSTCEPSIDSTTQQDEEISSRKPIEALDDILDKAEADLNKISNDTVTHELTIDVDRSHLLQSAHVNGQMSDRSSNPSFHDTTTQDAESIRETATLNVVQLSPVAEAVNEFWNSQEKFVHNENIDTRSIRSNLKENEAGRARKEYKENNTLVFNFVENTSERGSKKNSLDESSRTESKDIFATNADAYGNNPDEEQEVDQRETVSASNYNVILKMRPQPRPRTDTGRKSPSSDSTCSYYSFRTDSDTTKSRSNTDASYESVPPPLPSQPIPEANELDDAVSIYSIVSSTSSNNALLNEQEQEEGADSAPTNDFGNSVRPKMFTISTYSNRNQKKSYTKRLTRSESLQNISRPLDIEQMEARTLSLQRNQTARHDFVKNSPFNAANIASNSLERSHRYRNGGKEQLEKAPKIIEEIVKTEEPAFVKTEEPAFVKTEEPAFVKTEEPALKLAKPTVPLRVSKWYQEFNKEYIGPRTKQTNLRKTKSTADIRMNDGQGQAQASGPDPGLAHEYVKLQNDFMKWQTQLMQNQNLLHSKVAPIAAPNMMMGQNMQMPYAVEPETPKRREINIPIRMEGDDETFVNQTSTFTTTDSMNSMGNTGMPNNLANQSQRAWNQPPNVTMGAWNDRPTNVECVMVTDPPHVFQAPQDPRFMPVFVQRESNPSPVFRPAVFPDESAFAQRQFEPVDNAGMNANQFGVFPNRQQFADSSGQQFVPNRQQYADGPAPVGGKFQPVFDQGAAEMNIRSEPSNAPTFISSQKKPSFTPQPMARDDPSGKYTSVTTLSNDNGRPASTATKGRSPQFNSVAVTSSSQGEPSKTDNGYAPQRQAASSWANTGTNVSNSSPAGWKKSPSPEKVFVSPAAKDSSTPMSSRLVQAASTQPTAYEPMSNVVPSTYDNGSRFTSSYAPTKTASAPMYEDTARAAQPSPPNFEPRPQQSSQVAGARLSPKPFEPPKPAVPAKQQHTFAAPQKLESECQPMRISPPRRQKKSPSPMRQDIQSSNTLEGRRGPSPIRDQQLSDSFAGLKSPSSAVPDTCAAQVPAGPPCPPLPMDVPPPPPPPPARMPAAVRRTSTGKKIFSSDKAPELDAREELMMAIRKFGGSKSLRETGNLD